MQGEVKMNKKAQKDAFTRRNSSRKQQHLAEKKEKPINRIAADLGISEKILYRWMQASRETMGKGLPAFPGHGRPRDAELARLRKENKALKEASD
jgi:transposase-like protein